MATVIVGVPQLKKCVQVVLLNDIDQQCRKLCAKSTQEPSVLRVSRKDQKHLSDFEWKSILREMKGKAPDVLDVLTTIAIPRIKEDGSQVAPLCTAFGILMNTRSRELSLVQKVNTVILGAGSATKRVTIYIFISLFLLCSFCFVLISSYWPVKAKIFQFKSFFVFFNVGYYLQITILNNLAILFR